jgi:alkylated DNA repair dioxygenase AlkB
MSITHGKEEEEASDSETETEVDDHLVPPPMAPAVIARAIPQTRSTVVISEEECDGSRSECLLLHGFLDPQERAAIHSEIMATPQECWRDVHQMMKTKTPETLLRRTLWCDIVGRTSYKYSNTRNVSLDKPHRSVAAVARDLSERLKVILGHDVPLNAYLVNWYAAGNHFLGMHSDDEPALGHDPTIVSISLGAARDFVLKRATEGERAKQWERLVLRPAKYVPYPKGAYKKDERRIKLKDGDVLIMSGATQRFWQHGVPKEDGVSSARINITIRPHYPNLNPPPKKRVKTK